MADDFTNSAVSSPSPSAASSSSSDEQPPPQQPPLNDVVSPSPPPPPPPPPPSSFTVALAATPERKPTDDSRRLFQRLWTDEDEIELLRGYLDYTAARGGGGGGHHDTAAFYDQIKNKLQLEFNKNQLVEKLRRLKKKYRNVISKMSAGKEFVFKSPHDHATFDISRKIWSNLLCSNVEFDDSDHNTNTNPNLSNSACVTFGAGGGLMKLSSTMKRLREPNDDNNFHSNSGNNNNNDDDVVFNAVSNVLMKNVGVSSSSLQVFVEETIKNCLSPVLKELVNNTVVNCETNANQCTGGEGGGGGGGGSVGIKGVGELALNAMPLHFPGVNVEGGMDEKWRKQQIIELEVYSKRLELVQDQIKSTLDELRSIN